MDKCSKCNVPGLPWCWLGSSGRCDWLATPHWAAHNAGRSPLGPPAAPPAEAQAIDPAEAARIRRADKARVPLGCGTCHGKPPDPPG